MTGSFLKFESKYSKFEEDPKIVLGMGTLNVESNCEQVHLSRVCKIASADTTEKTFIALK